MKLNIAMFLTASGPMWTLLTILLAKFLFIGQFLFPTLPVASSINAISAGFIVLAQPVAEK